MQQFASQPVFRQSRRPQHGKNSSKHDVYSKQRCCCHVVALPPSHRPKLVDSCPGLDLPGVFVFVCRGTSKGRNSVGEKKSGGRGNNTSMQPPRCSTAKDVTQECCAIAVHVYICTALSLPPSLRPKCRIWVHLAPSCSRLLAAPTRKIYSAIYTCEKYTMTTCARACV
ncbi:unnamed protein product [Ectocarpus fasciculatus]